MKGRRLRGSGSGRRRLLAATALSLYALLALVSPALHHDLACHVKSPAHCDACVANPQASRVEARAGLEAPTLPSVGDAPRCESERAAWAPVAPTCGRSPPC